MNIFCLESSTTYGTVAMLKVFTENPKITFYKVLLNVKTSVVETDDSEEWAVRFFCRSEEPDNYEFQIRLKTLTCGYLGTGPHDLQECMKITGFYREDLVSERDIFHTQWLVKSVEK